MRLPPGYANGPGLLTLAAEAARTDSPWHDAGVRASDAVNMMLRMINVMKPTERSRHIDIQYFAIQDWRHQCHLELRHVPGIVNPADDLTKALGWVLHS